MSSNRKIYKEGDYTIESLDITSLVSGKRVNIIKLFKTIDIYEDMFSSYITAKLNMTDGLNLPEYLPITGQERVSIVFSPDIEEFEKTQLVFRVYKLDDHSIDERGENQEYTLHLISEGGYFNYTEKCGYSLSGSTSNMVARIFSKHFPEQVWQNKIDIEETMDNYSFIFPLNNSPLASISWLTTKAFSREGKEYSPYLFYETFDGYSFKSLEKIIKDGSVDILPYFYISPNVPKKGNSSPYSSVLPAIYHQVQNLSEISRFDVSEHIMFGTISSSLNVHDIVRKQLRTVEFVESEIFNEKIKLGKGSFFREGTDSESYRLTDRGSSIFYHPSASYTVWTPSNNITDNSKIESLHNYRNYHLNSMITQRISIDIFGDNRKRVGDVIRLFVPKLVVDGWIESDKSDSNLSGEFVITAVRHMLGSAYMCRLELSRNCMGVE